MYLHFPYPTMKKPSMSCRLDIPFVPMDGMGMLKPGGFPPVLRQAKNMGCVVRAFDVRPATREQVVAAGGPEPEGELRESPPRWVVKSKGILPKSLNSGFGIITICPDAFVMRFLFEGILAGVWGRFLWFPFPCRRFEA